MHISESKIKKIIHQWPEEIFEIIMMIQKNKELNHYVYQLPSNEGSLEFNVNKKTKKIDISYHPKENLKFQRRFKQLLGEVYKDIEADKQMGNYNKKKLK